MRVQTKIIKTKYWCPGENYKKIILDSVKSSLKNGDIIVISEKAISIAKGNIIDESKIKPSYLARFLAVFWMRFVWGTFLGKVCNFKKKSIFRLKNYPKEEGTYHKQLVLFKSGFLHALKYGSEGGIDLSNLPYSFACLPLKDSNKDVKKIYNYILSKTGKKVTIMIVDTDSTFSFKNFHFTSHPRPLSNIKSVGGSLAFIIGRFLKLKQRATPIAIYKPISSIDYTLDLSEIAHHARKSGAGRSIWDIANRFDVKFKEVTWEMLAKVNHYPIVLIRKR